MDQAFAKAVDAHNAGNLKVAEALYRKIVRVQPEHAGALNGRAMIAYAQGHAKRAQLLLRKARSRMSDDPGFWMNYGTVLAACNNWNEAEAAYRRAIELDPGYGDPYYNLGDLLLQKGQASEAVSLFGACQRERGRDFQALAYEAHALLDAGDSARHGFLLDYERLIMCLPLPVPEQYAAAEVFTAALREWIDTHPTLQANVMSTRKGWHTANLIGERSVIARCLEACLHEAVSAYRSALRIGADHPMSRWRPSAWRLVAWGVVMANGGHEVAHIHPNGWLSGVFYLALPQLINDAQRQPEGWLQFGVPTAELHASAVPKPRLHKPAIGELVLFPSYFFHGTIPFQADERRICIAFDAEPIVNDR